MFGFKKHKKSSELPVTEQTVMSAESLVIELGNGDIIRLGNSQHQGRREYQEDSCGYSNLMDARLLKEKGLLAVVSDGMGGLSNGKDVSSYAVTQMLRCFNSYETPCSDGKSLLSFAININSVICEKYNSDGRIHSGATLICAMINDGFLHWMSVGDSRIYIKRNGRLYQMNEDDDYLNRLLGEAIYDRANTASAFSDKQRDVLVSCIGTPKSFEADYSKKPFRLYKGDVILMCSDGVYNAISTEMLSELLEYEPQFSAQKIANKVLEQNIKSQDNLTSIVIAYN